MINSVEVLDPDRHVVWLLPDMTVAQSYCSIAVLSKNIVVLAGEDYHASLETLALADEQNTAKVGGTRLSTTRFKQHNSLLDIENNRSQIT